MPVEMKDIWDFHTDLRWMHDLPPERDYLKEQIDLPAARTIGGLFSATGRYPDESRAEQLRLLEEEAAVIKGFEGLTMAYAKGDLEGTGRQVLHAEGVYFIQEETDLALLDRLWEMGFRSLAPTYNEDNELGGGAAGDPDRGLAPLGREFAMRAWEKGFLLDCAHANHLTKDDMIDLALVTGNPLHYSHGLLDEPYAPTFGQRGLPRESGRRLLETGGLIGLSPHPGFVAAFERHLEEIDFLAEIAPDQVVLGSDFAGTNTMGPGDIRLFEEFKGVWGTPGFAETLAGIHGEDFARSYCGGALRACLERSLP